MDVPHDFERELAAACLRWSLAGAERVADTRTSDVFRVRRADGSPAVLKILKPYGADEIIGVRLLEWYAGQGAVRVLDFAGTHILMEWLEGQTLGDVVRAGNDDEATGILCDVIGQLHRPRGALPRELPDLSSQFKPMFKGDFNFWPDAMRPVGERVREITHRLFSGMRQSVPLHGDLHHDNVVRAARGWQVIDPKGLVGDPAYELSNVFRNPTGSEALARSPARIDHLAKKFSANLNLDRDRILGWAAAHTALSTFWSRNAGDSLDDDLTMLPLLLNAFDPG